MDGKNGSGGGLSDSVKGNCTDAATTGKRARIRWLGFLDLAGRLGRRSDLGNATEQKTTSLGRSLATAGLEACDGKEDKGRTRVPGREDCGGIEIGLMLW